MDKNCPHCIRSSFAFKYPLYEDSNFVIVCDVHPLTEGHILIIPKGHITCAGAFSDQLFKEFNDLFLKTSKFIKMTYGSVAAFEHGVIGQTVFHSHIHLLPFKGKIEDIVPEGKKYVDPIKQTEDLKKLYKKNGDYLFFSLDINKFVVDTGLGKPRFFRDRFANALGSPERGNWKEMDKNIVLAAETEKEMNQLILKWNNFF